MVREGETRKELVFLPQALFLVLSLSLVPEAIPFLAVSRARENSSSEGIHLCGAVFFRSNCEDQKAKLSGFFFSFFFFIKKNLGVRFVFFTDLTFPFFLKILETTSLFLRRCFAKSYRKKANLRPRQIPNTL